MKVNENWNEGNNWKHKRLLGALLLLVACCVLPARAQSAIDDVRKAPGELLAKGENKVRVGALKVKSYRLEEVKLRKPIEVGDRQSRQIVESAFRLVVTLDEALRGDYIVWLDDMAFEAVPTKHLGFEGASESELSVIFYGLPFGDGAEISVSQYDGGPQPKALSVLPERVRLPTRLKAARPLASSAQGSGIKLRSIPSTGPLRGREGVEIELTTSGDDFGVRDAVPVLQIGKQDVTTGYAGGYKAIFKLTKEQFANVKDGDMVIVKFGFGVSGGVIFGRLNKSLLDK